MSLKLPELPELTELVNVISPQYRNDPQIWELLVRTIYTQAKSDINDYHQLASQLNPLYNNQLASVWNHPKKIPDHPLNILFYCARASDHINYSQIRIKYMDPESTTVGIFIDVFGQEFMYDHTIKRFYVYNGVYWQNQGLKTMQDFASNEFSWFMDQLALQHPTYHDAKQWWIIGGKPSFKHTINKLKPAFSKDPLIWNQYGKFFAFENRIFNLDTVEWVTPYPAQYLNSTTGYQWRNPTELELQETHDFLNHVIPTEKARNRAYQAIAMELYDTNHITRSGVPKKFILLRNHNKPLVKMIIALFGNYVTKSVYTNRRIYIIDKLNNDIEELPDATYYITNFDDFNYNDIRYYRHHKIECEQFEIKFPKDFYTSHKFALFKILTDKLKTLQL
jgi:D5 N terminal like